MSNSANSKAQFIHGANFKTCKICHEAVMPASTVQQIHKLPNGDLFWHNSTYIGTTTDCSYCHLASSTALASWKDVLFPHTNASGIALTTCTACHENQRPAGHASTTPPRTGDCSASGCHTAASRTWAEYSHANPNSLCSSCHGASSRPVAGVLYPVGNGFDDYSHEARFSGLAECIQCHNTTVIIANRGAAPTSWKPLVGGRFSHSNVTTNTCLPCHSNRGHNSGQECSRCHSFNSGWAN